MWVEAGQDPGTFWQQTPRSFQLTMRAVRRRAKADADNRFRQTYQTAAFTGAAMARKLKPMAHYLKEPPRKMGSNEMLGNMMIMAQRANRAAAQRTG